MRCSICGEEMDSPLPSWFPEFAQCPLCTGHFAIGPAVAAYGGEYFRESAVPSFLARIFQLVLNVFLALRVRQIRKTLTPGQHAQRILDYGAGSGALVRALRERGYNAVGYEPSAAAVAIARGAGLPISAEVPAGPFDIIMFWQSLEHVDDPLAVIQKAASMLKPTGRFIVAVPNAASWEAVIAGDRWFHYDYPFHRIQFTPKAVRTMLAAAGFRVLQSDFFNPEYTVSGMTQTFLNLFLPKNALYGVLTHRRVGAGLPAISMSLAAVVIASPFLALTFFLALASKKTGALIVVAGRRED